MKLPCGGPDGRKLSVARLQRARRVFARNRIARRTSSGAVGQAPISSNVRKQPVHNPRDTRHRLMQGEGTCVATGSAMSGIWRLAAVM